MTTIRGSRGFLFDKNGRARREIRSAVFSRSYVLMDPDSPNYGECEFLLGMDEETCREDLLDFNNVLLVTHPSLPPWAGHIVGQTGGMGQLLVRAEAAEAKLNQRSGPEEYTMKGTVGQMVVRILEFANRVEDTLIRPGNIFMGGQSRQEELDLTAMGDEVNRICGRAGFDWWVEPELTANRQFLVFRLNVAERRGADLKFTLFEDKNLRFNPDGIFEKTIPEANEITGIGTNKEGNRIVFTASDEVSKKKYGLIQKRINYDVKTLEALEKNVRKDLETKAWPAEDLKPEAIDVDGTFTHLSPGNRLPVRAYNAGFLTQSQPGMQRSVRLDTISYSDADPAVAPIVFRMDREEE